MDLNYKERRYLASLKARASKGLLAHEDGQGLAIPTKELIKIFGSAYKQKCSPYIGEHSNYYRPPQVAPDGHVLRAGATRSRFFKPALDELLMETQWVPSQEEEGSYREPVDVVALDRLLESETNFKNKQDYLISKIYRSLADENGCVWVTYRRTYGSKGRRFAAGPSMQTLPKYVRFQIIRDTTDIDMVNAHPTIIKALARDMKIKTPTLDLYVGHREKFLKEISDFYSVSRGASKELMLMVSYGCNPRINLNKENSFSEWVTGSKAKVTYDGYICKVPKILKDFRRELLGVRTATLSRNDARWLRDCSNKARAMSLFVQDIEDNLLSTMERYLDLRGVNKTQTLMFDGLMVSGRVSRKDLSQMEHAIYNQAKERHNIDLEMKLSSKYFKGRN